MSIAELLSGHDVTELATNEIARRGLDERYAQRLAFELSEIDKQGSWIYWLDLINGQKRFAASGNPNGLVLPWLLGMVDEDPLATRKVPLLCTTKFDKVRAYVAEHGSLPPDIVLDPDKPDIDIDCLPAARDRIKEYAISRYSVVDDGYGTVCSTGTWQTFKFKSALSDVAEAIGQSSIGEIAQLKKVLPDEVDDLQAEGVSTCKGRVLDVVTGETNDCGTKHSAAACPVCGSEDTEGPTIGKLRAEFSELDAFARKYPELIDWSVRLVGRIKHMGMHAGALIIADRPLYGNIPLAKGGRHSHWMTMWTEGGNTQLSKFGYTKWDILGLKTLQYIMQCCSLIEQNRGISFDNMAGWDEIDPHQDKAGYYLENGKKKYIRLNDPAVLKMANDIKTDGVFQFDTELAKSILANGVRNFEDLMLFNAMGHPGPMASIPDAVANRDSPDGSWKRRLRPEFLRVLESTYGTICYQEQLQTLWQSIAKFTAPEAQDARKIMAKKWRHLLKPIKQKWVDGSSSLLSKEEAEAWWAKMETFGRYAFNRSHAVSYCLVAYRCLWLKTYYAPEWWAAVMSDCHPDKLVRYMGVARGDGVQFGSININNLTVNFTVTGDTINPGMIGVKGIGEKTAEAWAGTGDFRDIDEFVAAKGKDSRLMERLIKLGSFAHLHPNIKATWWWYLHAYGSNAKAKELREKVDALLLEQDGWNQRTIIAERQRQTAEYLRLYPKRKKIPNKITKWEPKPNPTREKIMALCEDDFTLQELLEFEMEYLGYYLHSPLDLYNTNGNHKISDAIAAAREGEQAILDVVVMGITDCKTKDNNDFKRVLVSDGIRSALLLLWSNDIDRIQAMERPDRKILELKAGVRAYVEYDDRRGTFTLTRGQPLMKLQPRARHAAPR